MVTSLKMNKFIEQFIAVSAELVIWNTFAYSSLNEHFLIFWLPYVIETYGLSTSTHPARPKGQEIYRGD